MTEKPAQTSTFRLTGMFIKEPATKEHTYQVISFTMKQEFYVYRETQIVQT